MGKKISRMNLKEVIQQNDLPVAPYKNAYISVD
jgi:hypothetical protein